MTLIPTLTRNTVNSFSNVSLTAYRLTYPNFYTSPSGNNTFSPTLNDDDGVLIPTVTQENVIGNVQIIEPETSLPSLNGSIIEQKVIFFTNHKFSFYDADLEGMPYDTFLAYQGSMYKIQRNGKIQNNTYFEYTCVLDRTEAIPSP